MAEMELTDSTSRERSTLRLTHGENGAVRLLAKDSCDNVIVALDCEQALFLAEFVTPGVAGKIADAEVRAAEARQALSENITQGEALLQQALADKRRTRKLDQRDIDWKRKEIKTQRADIETLNGTIDRMVDEQNALKMRISVLQRDPGIKELAKMEAEIEALQKLRLEIVGRNGKLCGIADKLKQDNGWLQRRVDSLEKDNKTLRGMNCRLAEERDCSAREIGRLKTETSRLAHVIIALQKNVEDGALREGRLCDLLAEAKRTAEHSSEQSSIDDDTYREQQEMIDRLQNRDANASHRITNLLAEIDKLRTRISDAQAFLERGRELDG